MFWHIVRILLGFALASLAATATLVAFVYVPGDWEGLRADLGNERLSEAGYFIGVSAPWVALCAVAPALAGVVFAESNKITGAMFYAAVGFGIALAGFFIQYSSEAGIFQAYALIAFLAAGVIGGLVYWFSAGCYAGKAPGAAAK
jgi:hypothetical protein